MNDVDIYKQETIRAFDELFKSCSEHENNATEEDLPKLLTFGFGVYVAACSIMGEECANKLADQYTFYASESFVDSIRPKLRIVK
jgi:hypothetical protein